MDLKQEKLTANEWTFLEKPIDKNEKNILEFIYNSYNKINCKYNTNISLLNYLKLKNKESYHLHFYKEYFENIFKKIFNKMKIKPLKIKNKKINFKKADIIRIRNSQNRIKSNKLIYEFILVEYLHDNINNKKFEKCYYTISKLISYNVEKMNTYVIQNIKYLLEKMKPNIKIKNILKNAGQIIEKNEYIKKYSDIQLYSHQKELFYLCKNKDPKLILYQAPTGTGKTVSPIGLAKQHKLIFVCAAKHIGLQLAKNCISLGIKIAIAFGCIDPSDIRLHYFAAKEYTKNRKTGGIFRVDNSVGDNVEIIISDIKSYLCSMRYMLAFNDAENIIWYWDEPTITLDYETHPFHKIIQRNWRENEIPNVVLSSATLPKKEEIMPCIMNFSQKFETNNIHTIISNEFSRTIPIVNTKGYIVVPHTYFKTYKELKISLKHIKKYITILRYFDLQSILDCILFINKKIKINDNFKFENYFNDFNDINIISIKEYYLYLLNSLKSEENYEKVYNYFSISKPLYDSTIKLTTSDSYTLTGGPTIYLAKDTDKIGKYCLSISNISMNIVEDLMKNINYNDNIKNLIEKTIKDLNKNKDESQVKNNSKKEARAIKLNNDDFKRDSDIQAKINYYKSQIKPIQLPSYLVPNSLAHLKKWNREKITNAFKSNIEDDIVEKIMLLNVEYIWKILLIMGIGVFKENHCREYKTIMKELADEQKLYLVIASSDYIYGMNYQFCHGYIGKDLENLTKEKLIQAMGRIGRSNAIADYSIRLRNDELIKTLLLPSENNIEIDNINMLFC